MSSEGGAVPLPQDRSPALNSARTATPAVDSVVWSSEPRSITHSTVVQGEGHGDGDAAELEPGEDLNTVGNEGRGVLGNGPENDGLGFEQVLVEVRGRPPPGAEEKVPFQQGRLGDPAGQGSAIHERHWTIFGPRCRQKQVPSLRHRPIESTTLSCC